MSARPATARTATRPTRRPAAAARTRARRRQLLRRRITLVAGLALVAIAVVSLLHPAEHAVQEIALPLRHEDIIRQQAAEKRVDPALIAAVIYTESHFRDQTSRAGAKGLMQLMPQTADYIAHKSGGTRFERADLATPQINIAYGTWYLRYLLTKYHGSVVLTLAAYNAGEGKVDGWWRRARAQGQRFDVAEHIPFPETRNYVHRVLSARAEYRRKYARELGL
jgi:soluble lytic murein transglycosylase